MTRLRHGLIVLLAILCLTASSLTGIQAAEEERAMYRLYNPNSSEHFYTAQETEKNMLVRLGWQYEGIGWFAPAKGEPVYRLYNPNAGDHHYTLDAHERDTLIRLGWKDEKIGWYSDTRKRVKVYREYNPNAVCGAHNFTTDAHEDEALAHMGWKREGIAWYGLRAGVPIKSSLGALHVSGTDLLDENNRKVVLQGFSTFGLNYMPQYVNESVFDFLHSHMNSKIIRLALYTEEYGGYCSGGNQAQLQALIDKGVKAAEATGQYVIIDWHILSDGDPNRHVSEAKTFFTQMAQKYAGKPHVLYEICNEPNGVDWSAIERYAREVIPCIRKFAPDAIILVGTPTWSQDVDITARAPLREFHNIMYTLHFYAATHQDSIRNKLRTAHSMGLPVFVSEFGISSADGNGALNPQSGNAWIDLLNEYGISRVGWALSNKNETSALFLPGTDTNLSLNDLSESGRWFYQTYTRQNPPSAPSAPSNPSPPSNPSNPSQPDQPFEPGKPALQGEQLNAQVRAVNSWTENGKQVGQYAITLINPHDQAVENWKAEIGFSEAFEIQNAWNTKADVKGNTLYLTPESWNNRVEAGAKLENIGVILKSDHTLKVTTQ